MHIQKKFFQKIYKTVKENYYIPSCQCTEKSILFLIYHFSLMKNKDTFEKEKKTMTT